MPVDQPDLSATLRRWAALAEPLIETRPVDLGAWQRLVAAMDRDADRAALRLDGLLAASECLFPGLTDPLRRDHLNLADHRWLRRDREESYSDWLAWILGQQSDFRKILSVFNLLPVETDGPWKIERERPIREGRTDILIRHQSLGTLLVEVKTASLPMEEQLQKYRSFLKRERSVIGFVLLAPTRPRYCDPRPHFLFLVSRVFRSSGLGSRLVTGQTDVSGCYEFGLLRRSGA